jgi:hypothetical protein
MKIAVICEDDPVWALSTWERTVPVLRDGGWSIEGVWLCPAILSRHKGRKIHEWYWRTFGAVNFLKLGLFAVTAHASRILGSWSGKRAGSFAELSKKHGIRLDSCKGPNDPRFIQWLRDAEIDILVILVGYILKDQVLGAPRLGTVNKHAAVLPANRGLFPYFWARLTGTPQGISFHEVVRGVDEGRLLLQERVSEPDHLASMVAYYWYVFQRFPEMLRDAMAAMRENRFMALPTDVPSEYYGLPTAADMQRFRDQGGKVIRWKDILLATKL